MGLILYIRHKQTEGITFDNRKDGALVRAARHLLPELNIVEEKDGFCIDAKGNHYDFNSSDDAGYSRQSFQRLKNKEIKEISLSLELNKIY